MVEKEKRTFFIVNATLRGLISLVLDLHVYVLNESANYQLPTPKLEEVVQHRCASKSSVFDDHDRSGPLRLLRLSCFSNDC